MLPHKHAVISAAIGTVGWRATDDPAAFVAAMLAGVLPDVDHIVDYEYFRLRKSHRLILPLHGYEYTFLGGVLARRSRNKNILWLATLSYLVHLLADQIENKTRPLAYSLLFRAWHQFRIEEISTVAEDAVQGRMEDMRLLRNLFARPILKWRVPDS